MILAFYNATFLILIREIIPHFNILKTHKFSVQIPMADESEMKRIFGAFYGQLVGDALGSRYEFMRSAAAKAKLQNDLVDGHLPMLGGGMFR